jgi:hypothetical protein
MQDTTYEDAWRENEQPNQPLENAVDLAKRRNADTGLTEYEQAHREMERREAEGDAAGDGDGANGMNENEDGSGADGSDGNADGGEQAEAAPADGKKREDKRS